MAGGKGREEKPNLNTRLIPKRLHSLAGCCFEGTRRGEAGEEGGEATKEGCSEGEKKQGKAKFRGRNERG